MSRFAKRLRAFWKRRQLDRDLEDELRFHVESRAEETGDREAALRRFGNATALNETCRELWMFRQAETTWQDVRYACRTLARTPSFTIVAVIALALGIGADTAIFTIVSGAFSWNLGLAHIDRTILLNVTDTGHRQMFGASYADYLDFRSQSKTLAGLAAYRFESVNVSDANGLPERYHCVTMSANGFSVSEQSPALGRAFTSEDEKPGAAPVIVITDHLWQDRYAKDPAILGRKVRVNDMPMTVVGVMPPEKRFPEETDLWTPLAPKAELQDRANRSVTLFGLLAQGATPATARTEMQTIAGRLASEYPVTNKGLTADLQPIAIITGAYAMRPVFVALWAATAFVLLIACADVANMLLARGAGRTREISIRVAIGAGRARIVRQLLIESVLISIAGGFLGWLVALGGLRWFDAGTKAVKPVWLHLSLDTTAFAYLAFVSIATGIFFGLIPALRLARLDIYAAIKDGGQGVAGSRRVLSVSNLLITFEMALCVVLLAASGLMIRSAMNLYGAPTGVNPAGVLTMRINLAEAKYPQAGDQVAFHRTLRTRLNAVAGVEAAALASNLPFGGSMQMAYQLEGAAPDPKKDPRIGALIVSPDYFRVMQVKPKRGRLLRETDGVAGSEAIVVNESFAARFWPGRDAIGGRLRLADSHAVQPWLTVVGVIPDILQNFRHPLQRDPLMYLPFGAQPQREVFIVSRTRVPPGTLSDAFRRTVQSIDANLPVYDVRSLEDRIAQNRLSVSLVGGMLSVFAGIALLLASVGLYAVIAHSISQRTQELGVRMAIGGTSRDILRLVYAQGMRPLALGIALGLPAALGVTSLLRTALVGVSPRDAATFVVSVLMLTLAGALGCAIPARRAIRVDPVVALRYE